MNIRVLFGGLFAELIGLRFGATDVFKLQPTKNHNLT